MKAIKVLIHNISQCEDRSSYVQIALCDFADNSIMHWWRNLFASGIPVSYQTLTSTGPNTLILLGVPILGRR